MQVFISLPGGAAPTRRAGQKAQLHQVWFIYIFQRHRFFTDGGCQRIQAYRAAAVIFDNGTQHTTVHRIQAQIIDLQSLQRLVGNRSGDLAVSLHSPDPQQRAVLMPIERAYPIEKTIALLRTYDFCRRTPSRPAEGTHQRRLSFEYIVFGGVNDTLRHADALLRLLHGLDCRVNLIRFHPIPATSLHGAPEETMLRLRDYLTSHGVFTTIRASRGQDIYAACGLLSTAKQQAGHH